MRPLEEGADFRRDREGAKLVRAAVEVEHPLPAKGCEQDTLLRNFAEHKGPDGLNRAVTRLLVTVVHGHLNVATATCVARPLRGKLCGSMVRDAVEGDGKEARGEQHRGNGRGVRAEREHEA